MKNFRFITILIFTISSFFLSSSLATNVRSKLSFSVDYIHRDSSLSPYHNSSQTYYERVHASFNRDHFRSLLDSKNLSGDILSRVLPNSTEYLMSISIGTPPFQTLAIVDTGSDLIWTQCSPCQKCYKQDLPLFDSSGSSTYQEISCDDGACYSSKFKCDNDQKCSYQYSYGDGSAISGVVATDTITFDSSTGQKISIDNINIGCTQQSEGTFGSFGSGIIGLSSGPLSLISQLGEQIDNKFSYCLMSISAIGSSSTFTFGSSAKYPGDSNVVKVPIIQSKMYYFLSLESIYIGNTYVLMDDIVPSGNIIIDSGTTLTYIPSSTLDGLIQTISPLVTLPTYQDTSGLFQLCYNVGGPLSSENLHDILPNLNLDFGNGSVVSLPPSNTFLAISESIVCLAILSSDGVGTSILGNIAQQNFFMEYDVGKHELSFAPMNCSNY